MATKTVVQTVKVMLEVTCPECGSRGAVLPMPDADPVLLDATEHAAIESQALDIYNFACGPLATCEVCDGTQAQLKEIYNDNED